LKKILSLLILSVLLFAEDRPSIDINKQLQKYQDLAQEFVNKSQDSLQYYGDKAIELADKTSDLEIRQDVYYNIGYYYKRSGLYDSASVILENALKYYKQSKDSTGIGKSKNQIGHLYRLKSEYLKARAYYKDAIQIHENFDNKKELGRSLTNLANLYTKAGDYNKSIDLLLRASENYQQIDFTEGFAWLDFSMSMLYNSVGESQKALEYVKNSLDTYETLGDSIGIRLCYSQLGYLYTHDFDSLEKGLEYQKKTLALARDLGIKVIIADGLAGLAQTYYKMKNYDQAKDYFKKSSNYRLESGMLSGISNNFKYLGYIEAENGNYYQAKKYYDQSIFYAREANKKGVMRDIYQALSELYEKKGNSSKALEYLKKYIHLDNIILSNEVTKKVASTQLKHELKIKEQQNRYLKQQNKIQELKITKGNLSRNILIIILSFTIILLGFIIYLYYKNKKIQKLKRLIPICSNCKKIRTDEGYYEQVESYISKHTGSDFSHGICPDCMEELYPDTYERIKEKNKI